VTSADRIELLSVVQMQIDNVHREVETQMQRTSQLETLMAGIEDKLRELVALSEWLRDDGGSRPTPGAGFPRKMSH
jgi:hypothetical protein